MFASRHLFVLTAIGSLLLAGRAAAQVVYWDGGGGNTAWATANNWSNNAVPGTATNVQFDDSHIAVLPGTISLSGNRTANSLTFSTGDALSLINGTLTRTLTLTSGAITRTATSSGSQSLAFSTLALGANGNFTINGSGDFTISSAVTGAYSVASNGTGTLILSGTNTFSGGLTVNTGTLGFGNNAAAGTGTLTLAGGTVYADSAARTLTNAVTVSGNVGVGGSNDLTLSGAAALGSANRTFTVDNTGITTLSGVVGSSGTSGLTKAGAGTLVLSGANTFTGNLAVNAGALSISSDGNLGAAANNVTLNGGTLQSTGTFTAGASRVFTVGASGGTFDVSSGQNLTLGTAGQLAGSGSLTKTSAGTLTLSNSNTGFTGNTNVNGGVLTLSTYDALGTSGTNTLTLNNGAELEAAFANNTNFGSNIVINNGSIVRTNNTNNKSGFENNAANSTLTINGTAQITDGDGTGGAGGFVTLDGVVQLNTGGNLTATAVNAADEVRFGGGQNIVLAAGSSITTAGAGLVSFGSGSARNIIAQGTSAQQATITLGAASNTANTGGHIEVDGSGTGGLLITGTKAKVDGIMTDTRLAATTGSGGTLTMAYTDAGSRALGTAANLTVASGVVLGLQSNGGTFTVGTAGGGTHDLGNWGGLLVGANTTVSYVDNNVFAAASSLTLLGGTLNLNNTIQNIGTLTVSGNSVIDFAGGASTLNVSNLFIQAGSTLTILNWQNAVDTFTAANWSGATYNLMGSAPMDYITFSGNSATVTGWSSYDNQIRPNVPEPSTYGIILLAALLGFFAWRRWQAAAAEPALRPVPIRVRRNRG